MNIVISILHLMRADFLERIRRNSFLLILGGAILSGVMILPARDALYNAFVIGGTRGVYNSAWVGTVFGVLSVTLLSLIGFYLVKGSVLRDQTTRVGQIISTTPLPRAAYMLGKWLSNLAVLAVILGVLNLVAGVMQFVRAEDAQISFWALSVPIWGMGLPVLALVSALAVLFESISLLRGGLGNAVFFFLWFGVLMLTAGSMFLSIENVSPRNDVIGLSRTLVDYRQQAASDGLAVGSGNTDLFVPTGGGEVAHVNWDGLDWTARILAERLGWCSLAVLIALLASIPAALLDQIDRLPKNWIWSRTGRALRENHSGVELEVSEAVSTSISGEFSGLSPYDGACNCLCVTSLVLGELRLMLKGHAWWWYAVALGLIIACLASPLAVIQHYLLPAIWIWPIRLWSALGSREAQFQTTQVVLSTARVMLRQPLAAWIAGVLVAIIAGSGAVLRFLLAGQWNQLLSWAAGAVFVPALALALGVWSGTGRPFEAIHVPLWYLGALAGVPVLSFMGTTDGSIGIGVPLIYLMASALLLGVAAGGRRRQIS